MFCLQDPFQNLFSGSCSAERLRALWRVPRVIYKLHFVVLVGVACSAYNDDNCTHLCGGCRTCSETRNKLPCSQRRNYMLYYTPQHTFSAPLPLSIHFRLFEIAFRLCRFIWMHKKVKCCVPKSKFSLCREMGQMVYLMDQPSPEVFLKMRVFLKLSKGGVHHSQLWTGLLQCKTSRRRWEPHNSVPWEEAVTQWGRGGLSFVQ